MVYAPKHKPSYAPKSKNPLPPKKDNPAKDTICYQYGEVGHWRRNSPIYLAELLKKKISQGASTSGIFTIELDSFPSTSWVHDTGCGTHIFSKNNIVYFNAIPKDGIYESDLSSSNINDSSMYAISNDVHSNRIFCLRIRYRCLQNSYRHTTSLSKYDIVIEANDKSLRYIELKSTTKEDRKWFYLSSNEYSYAVKEGAAYIIARIILSEDEEVAAPAAAPSPVVDHDVAAVFSDSYGL
nr:zinc finger, CCHC-type [Tanacetum cinerariifolium]